MTPRRFALDASWQRFGATVLAGSPLRLFRLTAGGVAAAEHLERGDAVEPSVLTARLLDAGAIHPRRPEGHPPGLTLADVTVVTPQLGGSIRHDRLINAPGDPGSGGVGGGWITVDDGSVPPLDGATLRLEHNQGPAAARNASRAIVGTKVVAFVDADVTTGRDTDSWLSAMLWHFDDPTVGLVAPRVRGEERSPLDLGCHPARIRAGTRVSYVPAAAIVVRVAALDQIGWFDEGMRFGEDVDLVWRLDDAGWQCRFDPDVEVWHQPRRTRRERLRQHAGYGRSASSLALRHPNALSPVHVNGWTATAWLLMVFGRPLGAVILALGSSVALIGKLPDVPARASTTLALRGHLLAGRQIASAVRRVWWPIVAVASLRSKRMRVIGAVALVGDIRSAPTDVAYGWGVWASMWRLRSWAPIVPRLSAWPGRQPRRLRGATDR